MHESEMVFIFWPSFKWITMLTKKVLFLWYEVSCASVPTEKEVKYILNCLNMSACLLFLIQLILSFQTCSNNCDKLNLKNKSYLLWSSKFLSCLSNCDEFNVIWLHQSKANCELYGLLNFCCFVVITCSYSNLFIFRYQSQQDFSWVSGNASICV